MVHPITPTRYNEDIKVMKMENRHNCNLCKKTTIITQIGAICLGNKYRGKVIEEDDAICDEYEFGDLSNFQKRFLKLRNR